MTRAQIAAAHVRRLRTIRKNVLQMAEQWSDMDEYNISQLTELADKAEEVSVALIESKDAE